jgi:shikimate kinase
MGAGKTTIGKNMASEIGCKFIDLDNYIEKKTGMSINEFFSLKGESEFRKEENISLREILEKYSSKRCKKLEDNLILALGGGTLTTEANTLLIKARTYCIYLRCRKSELAKRLEKSNSQRPVLKNKRREELEKYIYDLVQEREPSYFDCADLAVEINDGDLKNTLDRILNTIDIL